ncbi:hypothetical protein TFLX_00781 [Thermoflexales bacterium]|nr:hypothetical protein TFLX_00781 [Thermoflexales bacterium]
MTRILRIASALILFLALSTLTACTRPDSGTVIPTAQRQQVFQLQGRIQQGPSAGLNLSGELRTAIDSVARLKGMLKPEAGSAVTVTGQIDGQAIHLSFDLGNNSVILGVGTLQHDVNNPQGTAGGMLTGPQPGDSGDWFARWTTLTVSATSTPATPAPTENTTTSTTNLILILGILIVMLLAGVLFRQISPGKPIYSKTRGRSTVPFVKASAQIMEPERWPDEAALPLAQFATTYTHGDDHYDLSFTIEAARRQFLGECGVGISKTASSRKSKSEAISEIPTWLASTGATPDKGKPVTALEVWIFDKNDINTVTKVLRSAHGFYEPATRSSRNPVNDVLTIEPDQVVVLETKTLRMRVKVIAVEYCEDLTYSSGVFKQVSLQLAVWSKDHA